MFLLLICLPRTVSEICGISKHILHAYLILEGRQISLISFKYSTLPSQPQTNCGQRTKCWLPVASKLDKYFNGNFIWETFSQNSCFLLLFFSQHNMVSGWIVIIKLDTGETSFLPFDQKIHKYTVDIFPRGNIYRERCYHAI